MPAAGNPPLCLNDARKQQLAAVVFAILSQSFGVSAAFAAVPSWNPASAGKAAWVTEVSPPASAHQATKLQIGTPSTNTLPRQAATRARGAMRNSASRGALNVPASGARTKSARAPLSQVPVSQGSVSQTSVARAPVVQASPRQGATRRAARAPSASRRPVLPDRQLAQLQAPTPAINQALPATLGAPVRPTPQPTPPAASATDRITKLNPTNRIITLPVPLVDSATELGDVRLTIGTDDSLEIDVQDFLTAIARVLDPRALQDLQARIGGKQRTDLKVLDDAGYKLTYKPDTLRLLLSIPAGARTVQNLSLADLDKEAVGTFQAPANFSGYMNIRTNLDYVTEGLQTGLVRPQFFLDGAVRLKEVVLETEGSYQTDPANGSAFRRQGTRFVYDDRKNVMRWTLGDLRPITRGFQSSGGVAGISVFRSYAQLQPQKNIRPRGDRSFTLLRPSTVETFINDQSIKRLRLEPGTYNVRDFPFVQGSNDVRFVIQDDAGTRESIEFNLFFDRSLLQAGVAEFGAFAGVQTSFGDSQPVYETDKYIVSGFYRRGINQFWTGGVNAQFSDNTQVIGGEALISSPIGTLGFDVATSNRDGVGSGYAVNFSYSNLFEGSDNGTSQSFSLNGEYRSERFASVSNDNVSNPIEYQISATYSRSLGEFSFVLLDARFASGRGLVPDQKTYRISYGQRVGSEISLTLDANYTQTAFGDDTGVRLSLTRRIGQTSNARFDYETLSNRARLALQTSRGSGVGAWSASADIDVADGNYAFNGGANLTANRAELGLNHTTALINGGGVTDQRTSIRIGTSIAFADGKFAMGRPISDSFAIFVPHPSAGKNQVVVEPRDGRYDATSGIFGGALATSLSSFSERTITYDIPNAPAGYDMGSGNIRVLPPYRSGYLAIAGSEYSLTVLGRLTNTQGEPLAFVAGQATEVTNPDRPPVTVFTNREGRFGASGLRAGKWELKIAGETEATFIINIPEGSEAVIRMGDLQPVPN